MIPVFNINEFSGFFPENEFSKKDQIRFWALFANAYYERLFQYVNDFDELKRVYQDKLGEINNSDAKYALYYFYKYRERQLVDELQEGLEARREKQRWFNLKPEKIRYFEQVITDKFAKTVLASVKQKNGRCSERQYNILKLASQGNLTPSLFGTKN